MSETCTQKKEAGGECGKPAAAKFIGWADGEKHPVCEEHLAWARTLALSLGVPLTVMDR